MKFSAGILILRVVTLCLLVFFSTTATAEDRSFCVGPDDGTGTAELPPHGCAYLSPSEVFMIIVGLPPGTTIELDPLLHDFLCYTFPCGQPGGTLAGEVETYEATMTWEVNGTGDFDGFERTLQVPVFIQSHSGPRTLGDAVQTFPAELSEMFGQLPPGDPDFEYLVLTAGTNYGMPSPGQTTLTRRYGDPFSVDSFFDVTYGIEFMGAPGSILEGLSGLTTATVRIAVHAPPKAWVPCLVPDNGATSADLPPVGCEYRSPDENMIITAGLPPGTTMVLRPINRDFVCLFSPCGQSGGLLGGNSESFTSTLAFQLYGTGSLAGFDRRFSLPTTNETHSAPRMPGDPVQFFNTDTYQLESEVTGDPDFSSLQIKAGTLNGLPSPGQTILVQQGEGTFLVDSFFDIYYEVAFEGALGSILEGFSGTSQGRLGMVASGLPYSRTVLSPEI